MDLTTRSAAIAILIFLSLVFATGLGFAYWLALALEIKVIFGSMLSGAYSSLMYALNSDSGAPKPRLAEVPADPKVV